MGSAATPRQQWYGGTSATLSLNMSTKNKRISAFGALALGTIGIAVLCLALAGCGLKTPLRPPNAVEPPVVDNLKATRQGENVVLSWSLPATQEGPKRPYRGFNIYQAPGKDTLGVCAGCSPAFKKIGTVDQAAIDRAATGDGMLEFHWAAEPGRSYRFMIRAMGDDDREGRDSNAVDITP